MPQPDHVRVVRTLADRGFNAEREAVTLLAEADDTDSAIDRTVATAPDDTLTITADHVRTTLADDPGASDGEADGANPSVSGGTNPDESSDSDGVSPVETKGDRSGRGDGESATTGARDPTPLAVHGDVTGQSTGTGEYREFVSLFRDRYDRLGGLLRSRVNHRPAEAIDAMPGGSDAAIVGLLDDVRTTGGGHRLLELEDTTGTVPCLVMQDREWFDLVEELLLDEVLAVEGTIADDGGLLFVDEIHFPDVPRNYSPDTADRHVQAALISDVHVGSQEFRLDAWEAFTDWLHTEAASDVEYLLIAGDMVEGVGVYPDQDEELDIVDIYDQYERFAELLKAVPADLEIAMIPGNHDAVRLAEPQPGFESDLRDIMSVHDATVASNPSTVTVEGVDVLLYHGRSLDEFVAELPDDVATYEAVDGAMARMLRKRHLAPQYGERQRVAPETEDHLVIEDVPDVLHAGHVHKVAVGRYHGVTLVNSGCWQSQTAFQRANNLDPDPGFAPILDLDTLDVTLRKFV